MTYPRRDLIIEPCRRVINYHGTTMHFLIANVVLGIDMLMENDDNYCRVREVVKHVIGIDLEYVVGRGEKRQ